MNEWPEFNEHGDLPVGIYRATLPEALEHFGVGTPQRCIVARRLQRIYSEVVKTGYLYRFIIFGSFITEKPTPGDLDILLLMDDSFDVRELPVRVALLFNHQTILPLFFGHFFQTLAGHFLGIVLVVKPDEQPSVPPPEYFVSPLFHTFC
jgi:hypothetical protein